MRALFVAVNTFVLGMFLGGAALYIGALATGTVVFNPQQIAPCAFCIALAIGFFIASYKVEVNLMARRYG